MPRKQRFKPSRKPKPISQTEEAANSRPTTGAQAHNDNVDARPSSSPRDDDSATEPESDPPSR